MSNKISRRSFLKVSGASALALGAASMLGGCQSSSSNSVEVKVGDKISNWNNLGVQLTSVFTMANTPDLPDHEYVAVLVTAVNRSGATTFEIGAQNLAELDAAYPLDDEATKLDVARQYFHALAASTTDFTAVCDGAEAEVGAYIQLYDAAAQSFSESTNLPPQGAGYIQLICCVPIGWQKLSVRAASCVVKAMPKQPNCLLMHSVKIRTSTHSSVACVLMRTASLAIRT